MAITYDPEYPIPGEAITLAMSAGNGSRIDFELTSVPPESELDTGKLFDTAGDPSDVFTPDVPGEYGITAYDIRETGMAPPRFRDDPIANPGTVVLATQTGTVHVAAVVSLPITTASGHGARLELRIVDDTVRAAELLEPLTELSRTAILDANVVARLGNLVAIAVSALGNDFVAGVNSLRSNYNTHILDDSVHNSEDTVNTVLNDAANSVDFALLVLNEIFDRLRGHREAMSSTALWHDNDDGKNVPLAGKATTLAQGTVLFADLAYRVYERHRVQTTSPAVHNSADNANTVVAAEPLSILIRDFFDAIATTSPATVTGESQGAIAAGHLYGFV